MANKIHLNVREKLCELIFNTFNEKYSDYDMNFLVLLTQTCTLYIYAEIKLIKLFAFIWNGRIKPSTRKKKKNNQEKTLRNLNYFPRQREVSFAWILHSLALCKFTHFIWLKGKKTNKIDREKERDEYKIASHFILFNEIVVFCSNKTLYRKNIPFTKSWLIICSPRTGQSSSSPSCKMRFNQKYCFQHLV